MGPHLTIVFLARKIAPPPPDLAKRRAFPQHSSHAQDFLWNVEILVVLKMPFVFTKKVHTFGTTANDIF